MNRKKDHSEFYYFFKPNAGTWALILVHIIILVSLVTIFAAIISRMQNY